MTRVAIIDDHYVVRFGFKYMLQMDKTMEFAGDAPDAADVVSFLKRVRADILLLDLRLPKIDGITALMTIKKHLPKVKVIILTTSEREEDVYRVIKAGADGFVRKDSDPTVLMKATATVAAGGRYIPEDVRRIFELRDAEKPLSGREAEVVKLMVRGFSNPEIGEMLGLSRETVKIHMRNVFKKLGVADRVEAVAAAISRGLVEVDI